MGAQDEKYSVPIEVDLDEIDPELRPASQMRKKLNQEAVQVYAEALPRMPPVKLMFDPETGRHWLVDGCHTTNASKKLGKGQVLARVARGTYLEAFAEAAHSNDTNGVFVSNADKRHRVLVALRDPIIGQKSQREIAAICGVNHNMVGRLIKRSTGTECQLNGSTPKRMGKDGKLRPATNPRKPRKTKPSPAAPAPEQAPETTPGPEPDPEPSDDQLTVELVSEDVATTETCVGLTENSTVPDTPPPPTTRNGKFDWLAHWDAEERLIMAHYQAWPLDFRSAFSFKLLNLAQKIRVMYHAKEIRDRSEESLI